jgi:hypothetical protein
VISRIEEGKDAKDLPAVNFSYLIGLSSLYLIFTTGINAHARQRHAAEAKLSLSLELDRL